MLPPIKAPLFLRARPMVGIDSPDNGGEPTSHDPNARLPATGGIQERPRRPTGSFPEETTGRTNTHHGSFLPGAAGVRDFSSR
jgi:hypothetical protein